MKDLATKNKFSNIKKATKLNKLREKVLKSLKDQNFMQNLSF